MWIIIIIIQLVLLAMFRQRTIDYYPRTILMQGIMEIQILLSSADEKKINLNYFVIK